MDIDGRSKVWIGAGTHGPQDGRNSTQMAGTGVGWQQELVGLRLAETAPRWQEQNLDGSRKP